MFDCVNIPLISNPVGLDVAIQEIQTTLGGISWMEYAFGKTYKRTTKRNNANYIAPYAYCGKKEYQILDPNDKVSAFSFIEIGGDEDLENWEPLTNQLTGFESTANLNIIIIANTRQIDNERDYIFEEELKLDVLRELNSVSRVYQVNSIQRGIENAYSGYSYEGPYSENIVALKISCETKYTQECITPSVFNKINC